MTHGPSYLPKLAASEKAELTASLKTAAYYDTGQQFVTEEPTPKLAPLSLLLAALRAMSMIHQTHHWQTRGLHYYEDHLLFQRLYEESQDFIDQVAERAVGSGSEDRVDPVDQIEVMEHIIKKVCASASARPAPPEELTRLSLAGEQFLLGLLKVVIDTMGESLSPGTANLLEGLGDKHEQFTYLLGQRTKMASAGYSYDRR